MADDTLFTEAPAAAGELSLLRSLKVGGTRRSVLFPGLPEDVVWTVVAASSEAWVLEGRWCDVAFAKATITVEGDAVQLALSAPEGGVQ